MSAKDCLVLVFPKNQEPYVVRPTKKGEDYFSKKDAQRQATAHISNGGDILRAEVVQTVLTVNP